MILHLVEAGDGNRHVHLAGCGQIDFQIDAGEVDEIELDDNADEDEILLAIWEDVLEPELADDEALDTYSDMTVFRECTNELFEDEESSGNAKADAFMDEAEAAGWVVEFDNSDDDVHVVAKREYIGPALRTEQVLDLRWSATKLVDAHHLSGLPGDVAKRLSSVKGALDILIAPKPKPKSNDRQVDREEPVKRILKEMIPIDLDEAYDDEIISCVQGKTIVWWNNAMEDYEKHHCLRQKNHIKIETGQGGRAILTFISPTGFRSVAIEEIVQIR